MSLGISYSGQLAARLISALDNTFERWHVALTSARAGNYTADQAARDVVLQWSDYFDLLAFPGSAFTSPVSYVIHFTFATTDATATASSAFPDLGFIPQALAITQDGGGSVIPPGNITVQYDAPSMTLKVDLAGLNGLGLNPGSYSGDLVDPGNPMNVVCTMTATVS